MIARFATSPTQAVECLGGTAIQTLYWYYLLRSGGEYLFDYDHQWQYLSNNYSALYHITHVHDTIVH